MADDRLVFSSKIDTWLLIVLLASASVSLAIITRLWDQMSGSLWWLAVILALVVIFPVWILVSTRYAMSDDTLYVRCGPMSWQIPIASISEIEKTSSPLSSPALSLDRLRVHYDGGRRIMISPEPREPFVRQLEFRRQQLGGDPAPD